MDLMTPQSVLFLLMLLAFKHFICDGPLQTLRMVVGKATYGNRWGLIHAAIHCAGSLLALLISGVSPSLSLGLAIADMIVHYHIDFVKENIIRKMKLTTRDSAFWWALMGDQTLHQLTYLAMAAVIVFRA
jgi:hypothetical protein